MRFMLLILILFPSLLWAAEEPGGCWKKKGFFPCAYRAEKSEWIERDGLKVYLGAGASVLLPAKKEWQILEGKVWVEGAKGWVLSQMGRQFHIDGEAWIEKLSEKLVLQHFQGQTKIEGRVVAGIVPEGFQNWWTLADEGILRPIDTAVLKDWNRWARWPKDATEKKIQNYKILWKDRVEQSAGLYQEIIQRRISNEEAREDAVYRQQLRGQQERENMRKMFRDRYEGR